MAAYLVEEPNKLLLPFKGQTEKLEADMTLREVIAKIGKPQRYIGNAETGEIILQWDLQFNKKANVTFNELADPEIYRWCDRLKVVTVAVG